MAYFKGGDMVEIKKFAVFQNAKVFSILYFVLGVIVLVPLSILVLSQGGRTKEGVPWWFLMLTPVIYAILTFIIMAFICIVYNALAKKIGGFSFELKD
jgi:succinate dehydrogenase hydrophobic anchor subunit